MRLVCEEQGLLTAECCCRHLSGQGRWLGVASWLRHHVLSFPLVLDSPEMSMLLPLIPLLGAASLQDTHQLGHGGMLFQTEES